MWLEDQDYSTIIDKKTLELLQQQKQQTRIEAERVAMEEVASYLRPRYNLESLFPQDVKKRSRLIMMIVADITLYHLSTWLPGRMGTETREIRYEQALDKLSRIQKGTQLLDLQAEEDDKKETPTSYLKHGSQQKQNHFW